MTHPNSNLKEILSRPGFIIYLRAYTFEQFLRDFTNADGPATAKIEARNEHLARTAKLAKLDWKPVDPTLRPDDLHSEVNQKQAADSGYRYLWNLRSYWSERRQADALFLKDAQEKLDRSNDALKDALTDYTDMSKQLANAKVELRSIHGDFLSDFKNATNAAHRDGILSQVIKEMDSRKPDATYAKVIDQLYREISGDNTGKFIDMLQKVSAMDIDWRTVPTRDAVKILRKIIAPADPDLKSLRDRALAAITISFAKRNARVLDTLKIARSDALGERAALSDILKNAVRDTKDAVPRAKELAQKLPRLAVVADRLLTDLERTKAEHHAQLDAIRRAQAFVQFHDSALPELQMRMIQLERMIGAQTLTWEPNEGSEYWVAPKPDATPDELRANKKALRLKGVEDNAEIVRHIQQNEAWLNAVPEEKRGADWAALKTMTNKLQQVVGIAQHEVGIKQSTLNAHLGSVVDKMESTGIPSLKLAAQKLRDFRAKVYTTAADADEKGTAVDGAKARAMKALGFKNVATGTFERQFYRGAKYFAERNPDIFSRQADPKTAFESFLPRLRTFLEKDPDTAKRMQLPGAWKALEAYYRSIYEAEAAANATRKQFGGKVREVMPDGQVIEREPVGITFATSLRRAARSTLRMYQQMRDAGWLGTAEDRPFDPDRISREFDTDPGALEERLQKYVTPEVQRAFLRPLMTGMQGRSGFYGPARPDGLEEVALRENVRKAYEASNGSIVQTALNLHRLESDMQGGSSESEGEFVGKFVKGIADYFRVLHNQFKEVDDAARHGQPTPRRVFMDARLAETLPEEWLDYMQYGRFEMHELFNHLASQAAFGRNLSAIRRDFQTGSQELAAMADRYKELSNRVVDETPNASRRTLEDKIRKVVEADGKNYQTLKQARRNLLMVQSEMQNFQALMATYGGLELEMRPFQELVSSLAGLTVQGPGTALVHLPNLVQNFSKLGLGKASLEVLKRSVSSTASETFGTLFQLFHGQIGWNADLNARRVRNGIVDPDALRRFEDARVALLNDPTTATNPATRAMFKAARAIRLATSSGFGRPAEGSPNAYPTFKPHALFSQTAATIDMGLIDGWTHGFEDMISRAVDYFQDNKPQRRDPKFRFENMADLGYSKGFLGFGSDKRAFNYFRNALVRYGMDLESMARDVLARREKGENPSMLKDEQFRRLASLVQNEITLESNITNRPSSFFTNPILRLSAPLVGWSVSKTEDAWKNWRNPDMSETSRNAMKAIAAGILPYLALVPAGIAIGALRDWTQVKALGKQPNRDDATGSLKGAIEALAWTGTLGLPGDIANAVINRDTTRAFTPDNRIFFVSSLINAKRSLQAWIEQGNADWATVYRPLMQSLGGNGALQYLDGINHLVSLDNAEARVTARLNVNNYLRVTGRELGLAVRPQDSGELVISPLRLPLGQMTLAALSNDAAAFHAAYRDALAAARAEGKSDPKKYVAEAFASHNPLKAVFTTAPTNAQYEQMLAVMPPDGKAAVGSAIFHFNHYLERIGGREFEGKQALTPVQYDLQDIRRAAFGGENPAASLLDARRLAAGWSQN